MFRIFCTILSFPYGLAGRIASCLLMAGCVLVSGPAQAHVFYVENERGDFSASFPDDWRVVNNQKPDDMLTLRLPSEDAGGMCRVRVREDKRFSIYPVRYSASIRDAYFSDEFWGEYLMEFKNAELIGVRSDAGLGRGFASYAQARFEPVVGTEMKKQGLMLASLYGNRLYIAECSAREEMFPLWQDAFLSFVKSIDFKKVDQQIPRGNYRDFVEPPLKIHGPKNIAPGRY